MSRPAVLLVVSCTIVVSQVTLPVSAGIATITTADGNGADATVNGIINLVDYSGSNRGAYQNLSARWWLSGEESAFQKSWIRLDLPNDIDTITDARLELFWNRSNPKPRDFEVLGLMESADYGFNSLTGELRLGEDWAEDQVAWNNAPGNVDSRTSNDLNRAYVQSLYTFFSPFDPQTVSTPSGAPTQNLIDFLNSDTNGMVTFMVRRPTLSGVVGYFATKENIDPATHAPRLVLEYTPVPEPGSILVFAGLFAVGLLLRLVIGQDAFTSHDAPKAS